MAIVHKLSPCLLWLNMFDLDLLLSFYAKSRKAECLVCVRTNVKGNLTLIILRIKVFFIPLITEVGKDLGSLQKNCPRLSITSAQAGRGACLPSTTTSLLPFVGLLHSPRGAFRLHRYVIARK